MFNDEAHHAYRVKVERCENWDELDEDEREEWLSDKTEATVWGEGLDRIHKLRRNQLLRRPVGHPLLLESPRPGGEPAFSVGGERLWTD